MTSVMRNCQHTFPKAITKREIHLFRVFQVPIRPSILLEANLDLVQRHVVDGYFTMTPRHNLLDM
jgi:hypothetical protein